MKNKIINAIPDNIKWFDAVHVTGQSTPIAFKNNRLHSINEKENSGIGLRINTEDRTGFSFTNDEDKVEDLVSRSIEVSKYADEEGYSLPSEVGTLFNPYHSDIESFDIKDEISRAEDVIGKIKKKYDTISTDININAAKGSFRLINSQGIDVQYKDSIYSVSISCSYIPESGNKIDTWEGFSSLYPEDYTDLPDRIIEKIDNAVNISKLSSGKYPLFLPPSAFIRFLGIMLSGLNSVSVWKGISPLADKLGEQVFHESLSISDNPLLRDSPFSFPFDGEGVSSIEKELIGKGRINTFISDLKHSEKLGKNMSGNAGRGYSSLPSPSFSNLIVDGGEENHHALLGGIKRGIMAEQFIGLGQSNSVTGDFSASLDLAYLIENGRIVGRLKDCMISGNIYDLLKNNFILSSDKERRGSATLPYVLFESINFSA